MASTPYLVLQDFESLGAIGGYSNLVPMSENANVFLLSALTVVKMRKNWQVPIDPISDVEYQNILEFVESVESELMNNLAIGSFFWSIATLISPDVLPLVGQLIAQIDYPELSAIVPISWLSGVNIQLPDMRDKGFIGDSAISNIGNSIGSNAVTLVTAQLPSHNHTQNPHSHAYTQGIGTPTGAGAIVAGASIVIPTPSVTTLATATNNPTGGDQAHDNVQSSLQAIAYLVVQ